MSIEKLIQLKPHEEILMIVRESFIPHGGKFFLLGLVFLVPFFFLFPLFKEGIIGIVIFVLLVSTGIILFWRAYHSWALTVLVVTDRRVIDVEQKGFFDRVVTEAVFSQIDEVSYRMKGLFSTIFRYGTIFLELHGAAANVKFERVTLPYHVHDLINDLRNESHG